MTEKVSPFGTISDLFKVWNDVEIALREIVWSELAFEDEDYIELNLHYDFYPSTREIGVIVMVTDHSLVGLAALVDDERFVSVTMSQLEKELKV